MYRKIALLAAAAALAAPAAASAHVTLQPKTASAGSFTVLDVRVPNETDNATTTKVDVQFPAGFAEASYQSTPGWTVKVVKAKLDKPVKTDDGVVTEGVSRITWTADGAKDGIAPGQFRDFPLSVQIPDNGEHALTFKALQTYDNGEVVRWIGAPSSEHPAPVVQVSDAATTGHVEASTTAATQNAAASTSSSDDDSGNGLSIVALIVGGLGLLVGIGALVTSRRRTRAAA
jgi:periplasmic copper chaperone A